MHQTFNITQLRSVWLPGRLRAPGHRHRRRRAARRLRRAARARCWSTVGWPRPTASPTTSTRPSRTGRPELQAASTEIPNDIADVFLELPATSPERVTAEAQKVTAGGATPYDKALLLQDYFRDPTSSPTTSTWVPAQQPGAGGRSSSAAAAATASSSPARSPPWRVRSASRRGWRSGSPPGIRDPNDPNLYRVRGIHAHAWPEVYLGRVRLGAVRADADPRTARGRGLPRRGGAPGDRERRRHHRRRRTTPTWAAGGRRLALTRDR